jgi:VIT1/CCC1 family predicted Fe2+/Mn2+ transporter
MTTAQIICLVLSYVFCFVLGLASTIYEDGDTDKIMFWMTALVLGICIYGAFYG